MDSSSSSRHGRGFIPYISVTIAMGSYDRSLAFKPATDLGAVSKAVTEMESDVDPSNRSALSSSPSTTKLIAFPFTRLPIELQLEVGKQTLTFSHAIEIFVLTPRERTLMLENKFHYMQVCISFSLLAAKRTNQSAAPFCNGSDCSPLPPAPDALLLLHQRVRPQAIRERTGLSRCSAILDWRHAGLLPLHPLPLGHLLRPHQPQDAISHFCTISVHELAKAGD